MSSNVTASSSNVGSSGRGITGGYEGDSLTLKICIAFFLGLGMYNVVELLVLIFGTFQRYRGLYFWSLVISGLGIIPYSLGFLLKYYNVLTGGGRWFNVFLLTIGWYPMVTGQAVVLWSRLHLVVGGERGDKILFWTKWMIIVDAIVFHIPTTVLTWGSNANLPTFIEGYNVMEKIQMCGFFLQEVILSSIYIVETVKILRSSVQENTRRLMYQLLAINVLIIAMDLGLLGLEAASLYILETIVKGFLYSVKLKLEFAILSKLVQFVGKSGSDAGRRREASLAYIETNEQDQDEKKIASFGRHQYNDVSEFVDLRRVKTDLTHASSTGRRCSVNRHGVTDLDLDLARLEHVESVPVRPNGDIESGG